jgi:chromosome segregation ATPase
MTSEEIKSRIHDLEANIAALNSNIMHAEAHLKKLESDMAVTTGALRESEYWLARMQEDQQPDYPKIGPQS